MPMAMIRWYHCTHFCRSVLYFIKKTKSFRDVKHFIYFKIVHCYIVFAVHIFLLITFIFLLDRSCDTLLANPATSLVFTAVGIIVFALWGFLPLMRDIRNRFDVCFCYMQPYLYDYILGQLNIWQHIMDLAAWRQLEEEPYLFSFFVLPSTFTSLDRSNTNLQVQLHIIIVAFCSGNPICLIFHCCNALDSM